MVEDIPWWRHQMKTVSALLVLYEGNPQVTGGFPSQRPVTRSFDGFFDVRLNKRLGKQLWFERHSAHCDVTVRIVHNIVNIKALEAIRHVSKAQHKTIIHVKPGLYSMRAYAHAYAGCRRSCLYFCRRLRPAHTPTAAVKVQTCWTFKASADQRRHSSESRKRPKVTEGRRVVLHRDVCGRIPTHTLACLYFYQSTAQLKLCSGNAQAAASVDIYAGAYARMEYKPGLTPLLAHWSYYSLALNHRYATWRPLLLVWGPSH